MEVDPPIRSRSRGSPFSREEEERKDLLSKIGNALQTQAVPAPFWACLHVADVPALRTFTEEVQSAPRLCEIFLDTFYALPRIWQQKPPRERGSSASSSTSTQSSSDDVPRSKSAKTVARERDRGKCVITGRDKVQVCHIFPHYLRKKKKPTDLSKSIPDLRKLLSLFFSGSNIIEWRNAIYPNPNRSTDSIPQNLICLTSHVHEDWTDGYCAFEPIRVSPNSCELEIEFHWLPREPHGPMDNVDLDRVPLSSAGLDGSGGRFTDTMNRHRIETGDRFILTTCNPETHPLPSFALLEMAWRLSRIVSLSAAANDPSLEEDDDAENDHPAFYNQERIETWIEDPSDEDHISLQDISFQDSEDPRASVSSGK